MTRAVKLNHCIVDGKNHHVSDFAHLQPKSRPKAFCPSCQSKLTLKLSKSGNPVHHAAHQPDSTCPLTTPEGVLHYNTKIYIFNQLKKGNKLFLIQKCDGWERPEISYIEGGKCRCIMIFMAKRKFLWLENWDDVRMEQFVGNRKPDIVFYRKNKAIAAIEIFASHKVDDAKKDDFKRLDICWIEIKAKEEIYSDDFGYNKKWKITNPLEYEICEPAVPKWTCENCLKAPQDYTLKVEAHLEKERIQTEKRWLEKLEKAREEKKRLRYMSQNNHIVKARSLCFLHSDGYCEYHELVAFERCADKAPFEVLEIYIRDGEKGDIIASEEAPITEESKQRLKDNFRLWLNKKSFRTRRINVTNSWVIYDEVKKLRKTWKFPYFWDKSKMDWVSRKS